MKRIIRKITTLTVVVSLALILMSAIFPSVVGGVTGYTIYGRGHDHGWGLCMAGVKGMADANYTYTDILSKYYQGTSIETVNENQTVRVGLYSTTSTITISSTASITVTNSSGEVLATIPTGVSATVAYSAEIYTLTFSGTSLTTSSYLRFSSTSPLKIAQISGKSFYDAIEVRYSTNSLKLWAINVLPLNRYLYGLGEEPETWPMEGLKVLAVAARTYVLEKKYNPNSRHKKDNFDVCSTADCQYYVGVRNAPNLKSAVDSTAGQVLTHPGATLYAGAPGRLIVAAYHACCGGHTEKLSYLNGVPCGFCGWHSKYTWSLTFTTEALQAKLNTSSSTAVLGDLLGFEILAYEAASPRVKTIRILGSEGNKDVSGKTFYKVIGGWSAWFSFENSYYYTARLAGLNRYETAVCISKKGWTTSSKVILARGDNFPDALAGAPLAFKYDCPILLTNSSELSPETATEIVRLGALECIILGGEGAISSTVENKLKSMGLTVRRIYGQDRYETACAIADEIGNSYKCAIIASGLNFPDALAISSYAAINQIPIFLCGKVLPTTVKTKLSELGVTEVKIVGGTTVVSTEIENWLKAKGFSVTRWAGQDRYQTATAIAQTNFGSPAFIFVVTGENFPDALCVAPYAARNSSPILLCRKDALPEAVKAYIKTTVATRQKIYVIGGSGVISPSLQNNLETI